MDKLGGNLPIWWVKGGGGGNDDKITHPQKSLKNILRAPP